MVSISGTRLLLILLLCAFTCVAVGEVARDDVIAFKRIRGSPNLQASGAGGGGSGHGLLGVAEQEVGPSRTNVEGASDLESKKHPDHSQAKLATENAWAVQFKAQMTGKVENSTSATPAKNSTNDAPPPKSSPSPVPPPIEAKNSTSPAANTTVSSPPATTGDEGKSPPAHGGVCDHGPVIGNLVATVGEDGRRAYTLTVENAGKSKLDVNIKPSNGWKATPEVLELSKGQNKSVAVSVTDNEVANHEAKITISWSDGDCYVDVPSQNIADDMDHSSYSLAFLNAPGTAALLLGGSLVFLLVLGVAGVWGCISWRAHARRHGDAETKYQELEMTLPTTDAKQDDASPSADGWDEVWEDDDWQDTEAVRSSSTALTLSAGGLNSRRANKDGWDSSWDD